jgi:predicted O-linked N-acetylglucosamine transferase (SPINDLY family)
MEIAGLARHANGLWMSQVARNLTDAAEGFLVGKRYQIHDRDSFFKVEFLETAAARGVQSVKLPRARRI